MVADDTNQKEVFADKVDENKVFAVTRGLGSRPWKGLS